MAADDFKGFSFPADEASHTVGCGGISLSLSNSEKPTNLLQEANSMLNGAWHTLDLIAEGVEDEYLQTALLSIVKSLELSNDLIHAATERLVAAQRM